MKQELIIELKHFFKLDNQDDIMALEKDSKVSTINGLSTLIKSLNDQSTSPKEIAQQVEHIVVCISMKRERATDLEKSLKSALEKYQQKLDNGEIAFEETSSYLKR